MNDCKLVVLSNTINYAMKHKLTLPEFLLLIYFDNSFDKVFDINLISKVLNIDPNTLLEAFNNLYSKKIISLESEKDLSGKIVDKVSLNNLYSDTLIEEKKRLAENKKEDIFSKFEKAFGRPLSGMEIEIIKMWLEKMYEEELILAGLDEAIYNGVVNIRYIDRILHEWNKLGFKTKEDVLNHLKNRYDEKKLEETNIFEYNWLEDYDK